MVALWGRRKGVQVSDLGFFMLGGIIIVSFEWQRGECRLGFEEFLIDPKVIYIYWNKTCDGNYIE